jgi:hypothetical protein
MSYEVHGDHTTEQSHFSSIMNTLCGYDNLRMISISVASDPTLPASPPSSLLELLSVETLELFDGGDGSCFLFHTLSRCRFPRLESLSVTSFWIRSGCDVPLLSDFIRLHQHIKTLKVLVPDDVVLCLFRDNCIAATELCLYETFCDMIPKGQILWPPSMKHLTLTSDVEVLNLPSVLILGQKDDLISPNLVRIRLMDFAFDSGDVAHSSPDEWIRLILMVERLRKKGIMVVDENMQTIDCLTPSEFT